MTTSRPSSSSSVLRMIPGALTTPVSKRSSTLAVSPLLIPGTPRSKSPARAPVMPTLIVMPASPRYCLRRRSEGCCAARFGIVQPSPAAHRRVCRPAQTLAARDANTALLSSNVARGRDKELLYGNSKNFFPQGLKTD